MRALGGLHVHCWTAIQSSHSKQCGCSWSSFQAGRWMHPQHTLTSGTSSRSIFLSVPTTHQNIVIKPFTHSENVPTAWALGHQTFLLHAETDWAAVLQLIQDDFQIAAHNSMYLNGKRHKEFGKHPSQSSSHTTIPSWRGFLLFVQ